MFELIKTATIFILEGVVKISLGKDKIVLMDDLIKMVGDIKLIFIINDSDAMDSLKRRMKMLYQLVRVEATKKGLKAFF